MFCLGLFLFFSWASQPGSGTGPGLSFFVGAAVNLFAFGVAGVVRSWRRLIQNSSALMRKRVVSLRKNGGRRQFGLKPWTKYRAGL